MSDKTLKERVTEFVKLETHYDLLQARYLVRDLWRRIKDLENIVSLREIDNV